MRIGNFAHAGDAIGERFAERWGLVKSFEEFIQQVKNSAEGSPVPGSTPSTEPQPGAKHSTSGVSEKLFQLFKDLGERAHAADDELEIKVGAGQNPTLTVGFLDAHFSTQRYIVKPTVKNHQVELKVTDGKWTENHNHHGLWGNWTDEEPVYLGEFKEAAIREAVERTLLDWYRTVKTVGQKGRPLH